MRWLRVVALSAFAAAQTALGAFAAPLSETKLTASDAAVGDQRGWAVAISGDTIVVASHADAHAGLYSGSAYVYAPAMPLLPALRAPGLSLLGAALLLAGAAVASRPRRAGPGQCPGMPSGPGLKRKIW